MASKRILFNGAPATSGSSTVIATVDVSSISDVMILLTPATQDLSAVSIEADAGNGEWGAYNLTIAPVTAGTTTRPIEITGCAAMQMRVKVTAGGAGTCRVTISGRE